LPDVPFKLPKSLSTAVGRPTTLNALQPTDNPELNV